MVIISYNSSIKCFISEIEKRSIYILYTALCSVHKRLLLGVVHPLFKGRGDISPDREWQDRSHGGYVRLDRKVSGIRKSPRRASGERESRMQRSAHTHTRERCM